MLAHLPHVPSVRYCHIKILVVEVEIMFCYVFSTVRVRTISFDLQAIVSEEDGMESIAHKFLSAAVKV